MKMKDGDERWRLRRKLKMITVENMLFLAEISPALNLKMVINRKEMERMGSKLVIKVQQIHHMYAVTSEGESLER